MLGQRYYAKAVKKYGQEFADAVVESELQLHADNLDDTVFKAYSKYAWIQESIIAQQGRE